MQDFNALLKKFDYSFPSELIAQAPASPRDSAKLLVYDRASKQVVTDTYKNIGAYLPANSVMVFNQTTVIPARLRLTKETGGKVYILYISHDKNFVKVLSNKKLSSAAKWTLFHGREIVSTFQMIKKVGSFYYLQPNFPTSRMLGILKKHGTMPLPPYIKHTPLKESALQQQYQTVFAKTGLSVAAPTASLHFTKKLIASLKKQGIAVVFVNLNVGLGTFAPLREEHVQKKQLHFEEYEIDKKTAEFLNLAKKNKQPIVAVGTTVVRTLESACVRGKLKKLKGKTNLFIQENSSVNFVDSLITNFHVPKSSLLMLVSAFVGRNALLNLYKFAISKKFRLFSFGDGMLVK